MFLDGAYDRGLFEKFCDSFIGDFVLDERDFEVDGKDRSICQLGKSKELNLSVLEFSIKSEDRNKRIAITQDAFKVLRRHHIRNALIAFKYEGDEWRLSLLTSTLRLDENGKVVKEESNPRRYSYLMGPKAKTKTPYKYLIEKGKVVDFSDLLSRFSVEVVNKQFYNSIAELFMQLVGGKRNDKNYKGLLKIYGEEGPTQIKQEFAVRLIGRIVFCWFLKEKHSAAGIPLIDDELLSTDAVSERTGYYHNVLEPLFFEALNTDPKERKELFRKGVFANVPYLNGGLFSDQPEDHYKYNEFTGGGTPGLVEVPDNWFIDLFSIFNQYNFTVDENTSYDVDLSIDPEMLGRIFENLLAEINPQTGESARKSTGSFYTPREIVDYMVDNSLLYYLKDKTNVSKQKLKAVISYGKDDDEEYPLDDNDKKEIVDALDELTILDPACGSGAFPIGILQKVVYILQQADEGGKMWFEKQIKNIPSIEMQEDLRQKYESENYDYIRKLGVIRQSIFGVDIQTIATEIAKLRCFLTLVIEEEVDDDRPNRGVHALPNLDFKFVTANSLVDLPENGPQTSLLEDVPQMEELKSVRNDYFNAHSDSEKRKCQNKFVDIQNKMLKTRIHVMRGNNVSARYERLMEWEPFVNESSDWFDPEWMFGVDKFDIVIANPPYVQLQKMDNNTKTLYKSLNYETHEATGDLYSLFFERGVRLLKEQGVLTYITSNKWMRAGYGKSLRNFFIRNTHPIQLVDLGGGVFESATVDTDILILKNESYFAETIAVAATKELNAKNISSFVQKQSVKMKFKEDENWAILSEIEQSIKNKIERYGIPLKDWDIRINYGIKTGCNEAFIVNEEQRNKILANCKDEEERSRTAKIIRPILRGRDIKRNGYEWANSFLINMHNGYKTRTGEIISHVNINNYPAIKNWFDKGDWNKKGEFKTNIQRLSERADQGDTLYNLRDCAYMDDFLEQKIIFQELTQGSAFYYDDKKQFYINNTAYFITGNNLKNLIVFLNSPVIEFAYSKFYATKLGDNGIRWLYQHLIELPVPNNVSVNNENDVYKAFSLTEEEIRHISSSVR